MRLALLLLILLLLAVARAEDNDDGEPGGLGARLRAIDEAAQYEADHPDAAGDEAAEAEEEPGDDTVAHHDGEPAPPPGRSSHATTGTDHPADDAKPKSPDPTKSSEHARDADDDF